MGHERQQRPRELLRDHARPREASVDRITAVGADDIAREPPARGGCMRPLRALLSRLSTLFAAKQLDEELDEEIRAHLDLLAEEHQRRGLSPVAARAAARRDFGGVAHMKEAYREQRGLAIVETLRQDVRYALRMMRRAP